MPILHFQFGDYRFEARTGELLCGSQRTVLPPQPARLLMYFLEHADEVVTRDALVAHLWGEHTAVVFDESLNFCVRQVRKALGESARDAGRLETLPKRGYWFHGPVLVTTGRAGPEQRESSLPARLDTRHWRVVGAAALVVVGLMVQLPDRSSPPEPWWATATGIELFRVAADSIEAHLNGTPCPWPSYWRQKAGKT